MKDDVLFNYADFLQISYPSHGAVCKLIACPILLLRN